MRTPAWWSLGWLEFARALLTPFKKTPGGHDLLGLSAISGLLIAMIAMMSALHQGIVINFADSLLGYTPGGGVPLRVVADTSISAGSRMQDAMRLFGNAQQLVDAEPEAGSPLKPFEFHPAEEVEFGSPQIGLPGVQEVIEGRDRRLTGAWVTRGGATGTSFVGWAVALDSPLWRWGGVTGNDDDQLASIIANRNAFQKHFNMEAYGEALGKLLPEPVLRRWKEENQSGGLPETLYLQIPAPGGGASVSEFRVRWVESFPTPQRLAFLMPMETYKALAIVRFSGDTISFPSVIAGSRRRMGALHVYDADRIAGTTPELLATKLGQCLDAERFNTEITIELHLRMRMALPETWLDGCLSQFGLKRGRDIEGEPSETFGMTLRRGGIGARCADLKNPGYLPQGQRRLCTENPDSELVISPYFGANMGLVYVPDRLKVGAATAALNEATINGRQAFVLSELYQSSLARFSYLVSTLQFMVKPFAVFGLFVLIYVLHFQIDTWISHRRKHYGVLMARGFRWQDIYKMCICQACLATLVGLVVAFALVEPSKLLFDYQFSLSEAAMQAITQLGILSPSLTGTLDFATPWSALSSSWDAIGNLLWGCGIILGLNLALLLFIMWRQSITPGTAPIKLISVGD